MPTGVFAFSDRAASSSAPLINEPVDAALRGLATFWGRNPRYGLLRAGRDLVGEAENLVFATTVNASEISDEEKFSENQELNFKPMTVDPLYGVVGAALAPPQNAPPQGGAGPPRVLEPGWLTNAYPRCVHVGRCGGLSFLS